MVKLSIITINYNNKAGLEKTILSVINQSFVNLEYIVIDGGSDDGSIDIIKKYKDKISHWVSEKDSGIFNAQNKGLAQAIGEYCLFLNSGDYLTGSEVLEKVFKKDFDADIAYGNMYILYPDGKKLPGYMPEKITLYQMLNDTLWHPVSFIKRNLFTQYGYFNESFSIAADYDFFLNVLMTKNVSTFYLNEFICVFGLDGYSSNPANIAKLLAERKKAQLQYFPQVVLDLFTNCKRVESLFPKTFSEKLKSLFKHYKT